MPNVGIARWSNRSVVVCISKSKKVWLAIRGTLPACIYTHIPSTIITQMNLALLQLLGRFGCQVSKGLSEDKDYDYFSAVRSFGVELFEFSVPAMLHNCFCFGYSVLNVLFFDAKLFFWSVDPSSFLHFSKEKTFAKIYNYISSYISSNGPTYDGARTVCKSQWEFSGYSFSSFIASLVRSMYLSWPE